MAYGPFAGTRVAPDGSDQLIWTLDEATPPFANTGVWGAANLTNSGSPTYNQYGVFSSGKSVQFPGTSNVRLYSPDSIAEIAFPITLSCWVYITTYTANGIFVTKALSSSTWGSPPVALHLSQGGTADGRWMVVVTVGSAVQAILYIGDSNGNLRLINNVWNHIGLTYDGAYLRAYMNGNLVAKVAETRAIDYGSNGQWTVGDHGPSGGTPLNGYVDDIRFASVARAESWFNDVYTKGWGLDGHLITGISGASDYYESNRYSRSLEFDATEHLGIAGANYYDCMSKYSRTAEFNSESWGLPGPGFMGVTTYYEHRAWRISLSQFHFWNHTAPDPTGMFSGVPPSDLLDIVIIRQFEH
jgi:hypothetical protein